MDAYRATSRLRPKKVVRPIWEVTLNDWLPVINDVDRAGYYPLQRPSREQPCVAGRLQYRPRYHRTVCKASIVQ
jgi:hypothetical protein